MTPLVTTKMLFGFCLALILSICDASPDRRESSVQGQYKGILSKLYKKAVHENRPLILVLDNAANSDRSAHKSRAHKVEQKNLETSLESNSAKKLPLLSILHKRKKPNKSAKLSSSLINNLKAHNKGLSAAKSHLRIRNFDRLSRLDDLRSRDDNREMDLRAQLDAERQDNALRSAVIKNLLRYSNSLSCKAKSECQGKCTGKFLRRSNIDDCYDACEEEFECEEEDYVDPCATDNDSCAVTEEEGGSTKGERLVTVKGEECKRC